MNRVREQNETRISELCEQAGCSEKRAKIHFDMMVNHGWNPHPSPVFIKWWHHHPDFSKSEIDAVRARNCKQYIDEFKEACQFGLA